MAKVEKEDPIQGPIIHEYDGIHEADNDLPNWWLGIFYCSIAFALIYWVYYHELDLGVLPMDAYAAEEASQAEEPDDMTEEGLLALAADDAVVAEGHTIFQTNCVACHKEHGEGNIGPNLTDRYWIHGGDPMSIYGTIKNGVSTAGMPAWGPTLGIESVRKVAAFILSIKNTNVPGKEPQGEPEEVEGAVPADGAVPEGAADAGSEPTEGAAGEAPEGAAGEAPEGAAGEAQEGAAGEAPEGAAGEAPEGATEGAGDDSPEGAAEGAAGTMEE